MRSTKLVCWLALTALLTLALPSHAATTTTTTATPTPIPVAVNLPAGGDGWKTTDDGGTVLRYSLNPLPAGHFGIGSDPMTSDVALFGGTMANSGGLGPDIDTIVNRQAPTGLMAIGDCRDVPVEFLSLYLESHPFSVSYGGVPTEVWKIVAGLSISAAQPFGNMHICRGCGNGGTFTADLPAYFLLRYVRVSPAPTIEIVRDCGIGECPGVLFQTTNGEWTLRSALGGLNVQTVGGGIDVDVDADGTPDGVFTTASTSFQGGIKICGTGGGGGGGGGGGAPECARVEHVSGGGQDHTRSSHKNYAAGGDSNGDGLPDHCACEDANGDGIDDDGGGHPCPTEEEPPVVVEGEPTDPEVVGDLDR